MKTLRERKTKYLRENTTLTENISSKNRTNTMPVVKNKELKVQDANTSLLLEEMGMSLLNEDSQDGQKLGPTPPSSVYDIENMENIPLCKSSNLHHFYMGTNNSSSSTSSSPESQFSNSSPISQAFSIKRKRKSCNLTGEGMINRLSDEMILAIFRWLPKFMLVKCACVCKRWYRLGMDESLWRHLNLANKTLDAGVLGKVLDRGVSVLRLAKAEISTPIHTMAQVLNSVKPCQLQYLDLSMAVVKSQGLEEIFSRCTKLRKVSLENCEMTDTICQYISQNRNIQVLNLSSCQNISVEGLSEITTNCICLETLNLAWTYLDREAIIYLVLCLPSGLLKLNLSGTRNTLTNQDVSNLIRSCPHLKYLDLSDATKLTSDVLEDIAANSKGLEGIALSRCYGILPSSLPILSSMISLLALDVFGTMKEETLQTVQEAMPHIEINKSPFSEIARPTTGIHRTSIWGIPVRDNVL